MTSIIHPDTIPSTWGTVLVGCPHIQGEQLEWKRAPDSGSGTPDSANEEILRRTEGVPPGDGVFTDRFSSFVELWGSKIWHYAYRVIPADGDSSNWSEWTAVIPARLPSTLDPAARPECPQKKAERDAELAKAVRLFSEKLARARLSKFGLAADLLDASGFLTLIDSVESTIGADLLYLNTGIALADLEPVEGASQKNRTTVVTKLAHGETYVAPSGFSVYMVRYLGGGLSVQGAPDWSTDPESVPGVLTPPTAYAPAPAVDVDGDSVTAILLLVESTAGTLTPQNEPFTDQGGDPGGNILTGIGSTARADVQASELPAYDNQYNTGFSFELSGDKVGSYSMIVVLKTWKNGVMSVSDTKILAGTLPEFEGGGSLNATIVGWDGALQDEARQEITDINAPGNWVLEFTASPLSWTQHNVALKYASMTPQDEQATLEIELIAT